MSGDNEPTHAAALGRRGQRRLRVRIAERAERRLPCRPLTIHRYQPCDDLAGGSLGLLNLDRGHIEDLIACGFSKSEMSGGFDA